MKKIAVLTRDCAGVNATLRSVVRTACHYKIEVLGVIKGYDGLSVARKLDFSGESPYRFCC